MMVTGSEKKELIKNLQRGVDALQGLVRPSGRTAHSTIGPFEKAFPAQVFPASALHEFISYAPAEAASTNGFIAALAGKYRDSAQTCLWIGRDRTVFTPGLTLFGIDPGSIVFIEEKRPKEALWIIEEALKCDAITTVIGEIKELGFTESRRLQLAIEKSGASCFLHRHQPRSENNVACTTRWKITPLPGRTPDGLPGVGYPCWEVQLLKVRNGRPGAWHLNWSTEGFTEVKAQTSALPSYTTLAG